MPKWGLSVQQRRAKPWGRSAEWLAPDKTITDPIHGDIYLTRLERRFLDSAPLQRLRRIRQLGATHLVYPGASHTRLSHSLGALRVAQNLLDAVIDQRNGPHPVRDLFEEWAGLPTLEQDRKFAEATVLARLGGLLHDLCHVAFGHSIEDDLGILEAHDDNFSRFDTLWSKFDDELRRAVDGPLREALAPLIISKAKAEGKKVDPDAPPPGPYPFVHDIVGNTICADLIDYLARDHYYTGLPAKLGHRFIDGFYVTPADHRLYPQRMAILIQRGGRDRADVISELYKYLRYRYELSERALVHHAKLAADAMVGKALEMWKDALWVDEAVQRSVAKPMSDVGVMREKAEPTKAAEVDHAVQERLEREFLKRGDDGLLEHLAEMQGSTDRRRAAIGELATRLLDRALFKTIDRSDVNIRGNAKPLYDKHGSPAARRRLEQDAARFAGLTHSWQVLVWLPGPKMRFKPAHVLVSDGDKEISKLVDRDVGARGKDLQENHRDLWGVSVFVDPAVPQTTREVLLARLGEQLGITWAKHGKLTLQEIAVREIGSQRGLSRTQEKQLVITQPAARGGDDTFASLVGMLEASADTLFEPAAPPPPKQDRTPQLFEDAPARAPKPSKRERES